MDNLFPDEPVHDAPTPVTQTLSSEQATAVNLATRTEHSETTAKPTLTQTIEEAQAASIGQLISAADLNQADGSHSNEAAQIQPGAPAPVLPHPVPPTPNRTAINTGISHYPVNPSIPTRDMAPVDDRHPTGVMPHSADRLEQQNPTVQGLAAAPLMSSLAGLQSKPVALKTPDPAIPKTGETKKHCEASNQYPASSPNAPGPLAPSNTGQIPDEYPEDTKEELGRISANIAAARPRSEQARQVFASRTRIRSLLELGHTVKEIYNHLVKDQRVSADKVSFKQFERQIDALNLRSKPAKTSPKIRSTDRL